MGWFGDTFGFIEDAVKDTAYIFGDDFGDMLFGEEGEDPSIKAKHGKDMIPEMEQRQLMQSLLMKKQFQDQAGETGDWEKAGLMQLMDQNR